MIKGKLERDGLYLKSSIARVLTYLLTIALANVLVSILASSLMSYS